MFCWPVAVGALIQSGGLSAPTVMHQPRLIQRLQLKSSHKYPVLVKYGYKRLIHSRWHY